MTEIPYLPPPGPPPVEGCVAPDHNRDPQDVILTPAVDNNAVSGVVIDQNAAPVDKRGPYEPEPVVEEARKMQREPRKPPVEGEDPPADPNVINTPDSVYASPDLSFFDPEGMKAPDTPPEELPTFPPEWVDEGEGQGEVAEEPEPVKA